MPLYEYIDEDTGEHVELFLHHDDCDDIGAIRQENGRRLRRVLSTIAASVDNGFVSRQPQKWHPDAQRHTKEGWCAFNSRQEAREFSKRNNQRAGADLDFHVD